MTSMYFFLIIFIFGHLSNGVALKNVYVVGKYQSIPVDMTGMCNYDYLTDSVTYINMDGHDNRYPYIENTTGFIPMFAEILKKQQLLLQLQNNNSIINKDILLGEYNQNFSESHYGFDIFAGGLMMDWEAIIE